MQNVRVSLLDIVSFLACYQWYTHKLAPMTTSRLIIYTGLLLGMLLPVGWMALANPTVPALLLLLVFVIFTVPLIRSAVKLYREHQQQ